MKLFKLISRNRMERGNRLDWSRWVVYWWAVVSTGMNSWGCKMRGILWELKKHQLIKKDSAPRSQSVAYRTTSSLSTHNPMYYRIM